MFRYDYLDRHERYFKKSESEQIQEDNASHITKVLAGQLSYTTEEWLKGRKKYDGH
jgi:hypothetical protein